MPKIKKTKPVDSRPFRSLNFNDERKWKTTQDLDDVLQVGIHKAIGYLYQNTNYQHQTFDLQTLAAQMQAGNKLVAIVTEGDHTLLWVGDTQMMNAFLEVHKEVVTANNWSTVAKEFFDRICKEDIDHANNPGMYHVVCELFNSWCLFCERPIRKKFIDGSIRTISAQPYDPDKSQ